MALPERTWSPWRIVRGAVLIVGAVALMGTLWLFIGMIFFAFNAQLIGAVIYYSLMAAAAFVIGRWVWRRL